MESDPLAPRTLVLAALAACAGALLGREVGVLGVAAALLATVALAHVRRAPRALWCLVPGALAACPSPAQREGPDLPPGPVRFVGRVVASAQVSHGATRLRLEDLADPRVGCWCHLSGPSRAIVGDLVHGVGRIAPDPLELQREAVLDAHPEALRIDPGALTPARALAGLRARLATALATDLPGEPSALLQQLVLGHGPPLSEDVRAAHRATGLSHLLAVSGAHVTLVAALMLLVQTRVLRIADGARGFARARLCALVAYAAIAGLEAPVVRAALAFLLAEWALVRGRRTSLAALLAAPALVTALCWPEDLFSISFQLSYAAVLGLGCAGPARSRSFFERWIAAPGRASLWAVVTTAPLTLWHFGTLAPWTILATPLLAPLVGVLLAFGLTAAVLGAGIPASAGLFAAPLAAGVRLYVDAVGLFAALPGAPVFANARPAAALIVGFALLGALGLAALRDRRGIACLALALALPHAFPAPPPATARLELLAVGHGQACLVRGRDGATVLVDCGCLATPERAAEIARSALLPNRRLDVLVLTHADADHAGGARRLVQGVAVGTVLLPDEMMRSELGATLRRAGATLIPIAPGERVGAGPLVRVERPSLPRTDRNESSLWVRLALDDSEVIVPGDASELGTRAFLAHAAPSAVGALVLPHHGRANPATAELLAQVRPRVVLVSNRNGEPLPEAAATARGLGLPVFATGELGTLTLTAGARLSVTTARPLRY